LGIKLKSPSRILIRSARDGSETSGSSFGTALEVEAFDGSAALALTHNATQVKVAADRIRIWCSIFLPTRKMHTD
jgi:hypothetical protein